MPLRNFRYRRHADSMTTADTSVEGPLMRPSLGSDDVSSTHEDQGALAEERRKHAADVDKLEGMCEEDQLAEDSDVPLLRRKESSRSMSHAWDDKEKDIYETQLKMLQEQLVDSVIANQTLSTEIAMLKANNDGRLMQMHDAEKERADKLAQNCEELQQQLEIANSYHLDNRQISTASEEAAANLHSKSGKETKISQFRTRTTDYVVTKIYDFIADFTGESDSEGQQAAASEGEELTVKKLKANLKRCKASYQPVLLWLKAVNNLLTWRSAPASFLAFIIYTYSVWSGWLVSLLLGLTLWHLTKTYMISKGFAVKFSLLPYPEDEKDDVDKQLGLTDKFQLVLFVARKVQNYLGVIADGLEKMQNLFMWSNQEVTQGLYTSLLAIFILSISLPGTWFAVAAGLYLGFKLFIVSNIYRLFPRVKAKHDSTYIMWQKLPTHAQKERRKVLQTRRKYVIPMAAQIPADSNHNLCKIFSLPPEEVPLPGWEVGKRCTRIFRDKSISVRNGRLYLTKSFLCFESIWKNTNKRAIIPLGDVIDIQKAKPFFFLPGMSIEIQVASEENSYIFGAILNRDEVFAIILLQICNVRDVMMDEGKTPPSSSISRESSMLRNRKTSDNKSANPLQGAGAVDHVLNSSV